MGRSRRGWSSHCRQRFGLTAGAKTLSLLFYAHLDIAPGATAEIPIGHKKRALYVATGAAEMRALAKRYGINQQTVAKWKTRTSVADLPTSPKEPRSTVLSIEEEAVIVAFRRYDDCLYALQPTIPHLTRSSLHRCLQRHGIGRLPDVEGDKPAKRKFKSYPIGYFHIDIAEVGTEQGKLHMFVAIDRTSKFAFVELHEKAPTTVSRDFLLRLIAAVPYKIHTVLTDNGIQFTAPGAGGSAVPLIKEAIANGEIFRAHAFEYTCARNDIEHRTTKARHPWTTDVIDKRFFDRICDILLLRTGDRVAKSRIRGECPAAQPLSSHLICGIRARLLRAMQIPAGNEAGIGTLGLLNPSVLFFPVALML